MDWKRHGGTRVFATAFTVLSFGYTAAAIIAADGPLYAKALDGGVFATFGLYVVARIWGAED